MRGRMLFDARLALTCRAGAHGATCKLTSTSATGSLRKAARLPARQEVPNPKDVVSPAAYVSLDPVGRGGSFQIAVVLKIRNGFHINAREKSEEYLIATDLQVNAPAGFKTGEVTYPKGQLRSFTFSKTPLNVYEDTVTLRLRALLFTWKVPSARDGQDSRQAQSSQVKGTFFMQPKG